MFTDLVPIRTMLVEQCQPLRNPSLQNQQQQCRYEEMEYSLQEHNYGTRGEGNSQTTFIFVKQEVRVYLSSRQIYSYVYVHFNIEICFTLQESFDDSSLQSVLKQEGVEPTVVCGQVSNAGEKSKLTLVSHLKFVNSM